MREIKNVLICGAGAIGSIFANIIRKYDPDSLRVLVDKTRLEKYTKTPLVVNGEECPLNYILPDGDFDADLIIIATKFNGLKDAISEIKNFVHDDTIIISLLNGVSSEYMIAHEYGWNKILCAFFIGHSSVRIGRQVTHGTFNRIVFGGENCQNIQRLKNYFDKVGIDYEIDDDMRRSIWLKFMLNVSSNQISAVKRMTFGEMMNDPKTVEELRAVMKEVEQIAKAEGIKNTETMVDETFEHLKTMSYDGKTSMLQDVEAGRKTEVDMFAGAMIEFGKKHNIPVPLNEELKKLIEGFCC